MSEQVVLAIGIFLIVITYIWAWSLDKITKEKPPWKEQEEKKEVKPKKIEKPKRKKKK